MNIEIEKKFKVENIEKLTEWLTNNTEFLSENSQEDILFEQESLSDKRILRLRKENDKELLTFKNLVFKDGAFQYCEEFETEFKDENIEDIFKIISIAKGISIDKTKNEFGITYNLEKSLNADGFKSSYIINKNRKNYKSNSILCSLDVIKNLGVFLELEHLEPKNYEDALNDFNNLLLLIKDSLGEEVKKGYLDLLKDTIK